VARKISKEKSSESVPSGFNWDLILKIVGSLVAIAGVLFGVYQYNQRKEETKNARQYEHYIKATSVAAGFAQASTKKEAEEKSKQFWEIYYGELSLVEDDNVKLAMMNLGGAIKQWDKYNTGDSDFSAPAIFELEDKDGKPQSFNQLAYELSQACKESLEK